MSDEAQWEYVVRNGFGHFRYMARTLEEALANIAKEQAEPGTVPSRKVFRRRRAGAWEPVPIQQCGSRDLSETHQKED